MTQVNDSAGTDAGLLIERVVGAVDELMHLLQQQRVPEFLEIDVTMPQAKVLYVVTASGEIHMSALPERLGVSLSTVSGLIDRLVERGLLLRRDDPADRRQVLVSATAAGEELSTRFRQLGALSLRSLLSTLDAGELRLVEHALAVLNRAASASAWPAGGVTGSEHSRKEPS